jgi:hypothetical protein
LITADEKKKKEISEGREVDSRNIWGFTAKADPQEFRNMKGSISNKISWSIFPVENRIPADTISKTETKTLIFRV